MRIFLFLAMLCGLSTAYADPETCNPIPHENMVMGIKTAAQETDVPELLIAAVIFTESNFGKDFGVSGAFMENAKLQRDLEPFSTLMEIHNFDPKTACVSQKASSGGFGGAMGPGQFLPSTWMMLTGVRKIGEAENGKIKYEYDSATDAFRSYGGSGIRVQPWNPRDAALAVAIYLLKCYEQHSGNENAWSHAVGCYFAGRYWDTDPAKRYRSEIVKNIIHIRNNDLLN